MLLNGILIGFVLAARECAVRFDAVGGFGVTQSMRAAFVARILVLCCSMAVANEKCIRRLSNIRTQVHGFLFVCIVRMRYVEYVINSDSNTNCWMKMLRSTIDLTPQ